MTEFEPGSSGRGIDRAVNSVTTWPHKLLTHNS